MRVVFTGGTEQERFDANIAVAEALNELVTKENFADVRFYYFSSQPGDRKLLYENNLSFKKIGTGVSFLNFLEAFLYLFAIFPDVVFSSGGKQTKPIIKAAKWLGIPTIIHEPNSIPDEVNEWAQGKANAITIAYKNAVRYFQKENRDKIVHTGQPLRKIFYHPSSHGAYELLKIEKDVPVIWIRGGREGSLFMNQVVEEALPELLQDYQVIHQTGKDSFEEIKLLTEASLHGHPYKHRYHIYDELNDLSTKMLAAVAEVAVTRAGEELFQLAHWEIPSIVVPKTDSYRNYEIENAYAYARAGAGVVIEENNLNDSGLIFELRRILENSMVAYEMKQGAKEFRIDYAEKTIAEEIAKIYLKHELEGKEQ